MQLSEIAAEQRRQAEVIACPKCGSGVSHPCIGAGRLPTIWPHAARQKAAKRARAALDGVAEGSEVGA